MADRFIKMHGLGNDFVVIDARNAPLAFTPTAAWVRAVADRHCGIGCDQLILLTPARAPEAAAHMRIFNADGSEAEACGNATRCVATLFPGPVQLATPAGLVALTPVDGGAVAELPAPRFDWQAIPLAMPMDTLAMPVAWEELAAPVAVNVGNPHIVFFVNDVASVDLARIGPLIEADPLFPARVNVNVAAATGRHAISLRVWERGAGLTRACGTGACATAAAAIATGRAASPVTVTLPGGDLQIEWTRGQPLRMTGPATRVFDGSTDWRQFG